MDPLSLTVSLLTIIATAEHAIKGLRKIKAYREAPQEIEDLSTELSSIQDTLKRIRDFVDKENALHADTLLDPLKRAANLCDYLHSGLVPPGNSWMSEARRTRAQRMLYKSRFVSLRNDLRSIKGGLVLGLGLISA